MSLSKYLGLPVRRFHKRPCSASFWTPSTERGGNKQRSQEAHYSVLPFTFTILDNGFQATKQKPFTNWRTNAKFPYLPHVKQKTRMKCRTDRFPPLRIWQRRLRVRGADWNKDPRAVDNAAGKQRTQAGLQMTEVRHEAFGPGCYERGRFIYIACLFIKVNIECSLLGCRTTKFLFSFEDAFLWAILWK